jgi:hypothetical protein
MPVRFAHAIFPARIEVQKGLPLNKLLGTKPAPKKSEPKRIANYAEAKRAVSKR